MSIDHVHHQFFGSPFSHPSVYSRMSRQYILLSSVSDIGQTQRSRRWYSINTVDPPPAGGHLTSVATSQLLRSTRETALRTPGLTWTDEDDSGPVRSMVGGRETRKMNMYQAIRDALRYGGWLCLSAVLTGWQHCTRKRRYRCSLWRGRCIWGCIPLYHGMVPTFSTCRSALMYPLQGLAEEFGRVVIVLLDDDDRPQLRIHE